MNKYASETNISGLDQPDSLAADDLVANTRVAHSVPSRDLWFSSQSTNSISNVSLLKDFTQLAERKSEAKSLFYRRKWKRIAYSLVFVARLRLLVCASSRSRSSSGKLKANLSQIRRYFSSSTLTESPIEYIDDQSSDPSTRKNSMKSSSSMDLSAANYQNSPRAYSKFYKSLTDKRPLFKSSILKKLGLKSRNLLKENFRQIDEETTTAEETRPLSPVRVNRINVAPIMKVASINASYAEEAAMKRSISLGNLEFGEIERHRNNLATNSYGGYEKPLTPVCNAEETLETPTYGPKTAPAPNCANESLNKQPEAIIAAPTATKSLAELRIITDLLAELLSKSVSISESRTSSMLDEFTDVSKTSDLIENSTGYSFSTELEYTNQHPLCPKTGDKADFLVELITPTSIGEQMSVTNSESGNESKLSYFNETSMENSAENEIKSSENGKSTGHFLKYIDYSEESAEICGLTAENTEKSEENINILAKKIESQLWSGEDCSNQCENKAKHNNLTYVEYAVAQMSITHSETNNESKLSYFNETSTAKYAENIKKSAENICEKYSKYPDYSGKTAESIGITAESTWKSSNADSTVKFAENIGISNGNMGKSTENAGTIGSCVENLRKFSKYSNYSEKSAERFGKSSENDEYIETFAENVRKSTENNDSLVKFAENPGKTAENMPSQLCDCDDYSAGCELHLENEAKHKAESISRAKSIPVYLNLILNEASDVQMRSHKPNVVSPHMHVSTSMYNACAQSPLVSSQQDSNATLAHLLNLEQKNSMHVQGFESRVSIESVLKNVDELIQKCKEIRSPVTGKPVPEIIEDLYANSHLISESGAETQHKDLLGFNEKYYKFSYMSEKTLAQEFEEVTAKERLLDNPTSSHESPPRDNPAESAKTPAGSGLDSSACFLSVSPLSHVMRHSNKRRHQDQGSLYVYDDSEHPHDPDFSGHVPRTKLFTIALESTVPSKLHKSHSLDRPNQKYHHQQTPKAIANFSTEQRKKETFAFYSDQDKAAKKTPDAQSTASSILFSSAEKSQTKLMKKRKKRTNSGHANNSLSKINEAAGANAKSLPNCLHCMQNFYTISKSLVVSAYEYIRRKWADFFVFMGMRCDQLRD